MADQKITEVAVSDFDNGRTRYLAEVNGTLRRVDGGSASPLAIQQALGDLTALVNLLKSNISNPNLLDNPFFTVNQRNFTSFDNTMSCSVAYTVDRWMRRGSGSTDSFSITLNPDNTITLSGKSNTNQASTYIEQRLENSKLNIGDLITISVIIDNKLCAETFTLEDDNLFFL